MKKKVFAEVGLGNETFLSTEVETGKTEERINKFIRPKKINGFYFRIWMFKRVIIFSTYDGIKLQKKQQNRLKIILGVEGVGLN